LLSSAPWLRVTNTVSDPLTSLPVRPKQTATLNHDFIMADSRIPSTIQSTNHVKIGIQISKYRPHTRSGALCSDKDIRARTATGTEGDMMAFVTVHFRVP
ncbi:hypothetical protein STEG23_010428, partial [Scotinomys teguina]